MALIRPSRFDTESVYFIPIAILLNKGKNKGKKVKARRQSLYCTHAVLIHT